MKKLCFMLTMVLFLLLPGCSGCNKQAKKEQAPTPAVRRATPAPAPAPVKKEESKESKEEEQKDTEEKAGPVSDMTEEESKEKVLAVMPDIVNSFNSQEFKQKLQDAAKSRDFKQLTQVMQGVINDACSKHGLSFEECVKLMNDHKDDPEVREAMEKWRDSIDLNQ